MKKTLSLALVVLMVVAAFSVFTIGSAADGDGWTLKDGVLTVTKEISGTYATGNDTFPWADKRDEITKVVVADGVEKIPAFSFTRCKNLAEVEVGKDCTTIEQDAFSYCGEIASITFNGPIESIGQGIVYSSTVKKVTLTDQSKEAFLAVAAVKPYNTSFEKAEFTVTGDVDPVVKLNVEPSPFGEIENWSNATWFLVSGTTTEISNKLKNKELDLKVVIVDVTDQKTYTISKYAFDKPTSEIYSDTSGRNMLRIAVCDYGIVPVKGHAYTVTLELSEGGTLKYAGTSETGAFDKVSGSSNPPDGKDFWVVENPTHYYDEYNNSSDDPVDPPVGGEHTAMIAVLAIVALFGSAVVVSKKVLSR